MLSREKTKLFQMEHATTQPVQGVAVLLPSVSRRKLAGHLTPSIAWSKAEDMNIPSPLLS